MKTALILLALVVVLGRCREAGADQSLVVTDHEYLIGEVDESCYGFSDGHLEWAGNGETWSKVHFGRREFNVPFTATQGLAGFCLIVVTLITVLAALAVRWKKNRAAV